MVLFTNFMQYISVLKNHSYYVEMLIAWNPLAVKGISLYMSEIPRQVLLFFMKLWII